MLSDQDSEGSTPLLLGVGSGRVEIVRLLLKYNANINTKNHAKVTWTLEKVTVNKSI